MSADRVILDEIDRPDMPSLLAAYMVADGYSSDEILSYFDSQNVVRLLTEMEREDLADTLFEALLGVFDRDQDEASREAIELRDATVSWLHRHGVIA